MVPECFQAEGFTSDWPVGFDEEFFLVNRQAFPSKLILVPKVHKLHVSFDYMPDLLYQRVYILRQTSSIPSALEFK